jgi:hypothetical protein
MRGQQRRQALNLLPADLDWLDPQQQQASKFPVKWFLRAKLHKASPRSLPVEQGS